MKLPVYILAGGRSSRFGTDKARAELGGVPLLCHAAKAAESVASAICLVAAKEELYTDLGFETIADEEPGLGPLGGLATALRHAPSDWLLLLACDFAGIQPSWLEQLTLALPGTADACLFDTTPLQPLLACYHKRALPAVLARRDSPHRNMRMLLNDLPAQYLPPPADWGRLININTREHLAAIPEQDLPRLLKRP